MEVFGAAASAIALAQTAISLAQALNTYAGAVSDSVDDVVVIADDISDTFGNLQQLATVLKKNEKTKLLNETAVSNAQRCVSKSEVLLKRLRKLFEKSGATTDPNRVESEHIDISKFRRGIWIIYKSEFELRRAELHHIKADISLIYLTYLTMASGSEGNEKQRNIDQMKLVYAKRTVLDKDLKKLRARKRKDQSGSVEGDDEGSPVYHSYRVPRGHYDNHSDEYEEEPAAVFAKMEDLYSEFNLWLTREKQKEEKVKMERELLEKTAVEKYKRQNEEIALKRQAEMQKLKDSLTQHGLPPQRIDQIVRDAYPTGGALPQNATGTLTNVSQGQTSVGSSRQYSQSTTSSWFRRRSRRSDQETASNASTSVPNILRDASAPGGVAQLKALYFQKVAVGPARQEIVKLEVGVPDFRLMPNLLSQASASSQRKNVSEFLQGLANVPEDYRYHITYEVGLLQGDPEFDWIILQVEPVISKEQARRFVRKRKGEVVGVYVVLRKLTRFDSTSIGGRHYNSGNPQTTSAPAAQEQLSASEEIIVPSLKEKDSVQGIESKRREEASKEGMHRREYTSRYDRHARDCSPEPIIIRNWLGGRSSPVPVTVLNKPPDRRRPSQPHRRARFSESRERISSPARRRTTVYYSSDDSSAYYEVPRAPRGREARVIRSPSPPSRSPPYRRRRRNSADSGDISPQVTRKATDTTDKQIAAQLARLEMEERMRMEKSKSSQPLMEDARIERYPESRNQGYQDYALERITAMNRQREEAAISKGRSDAERARESRLRHSYAPPIVTDRSKYEEEIIAPVSRRSRVTSTRTSRKGHQARERSQYHTGTRRYVEYSNHSSDESAYATPVHRSGGVNRGAISAEDAVQDLLAEWTNANAASKDEVGKPINPDAQENEGVEVVGESDQEASQKHGSHDNKPAPNAPTVESDGSSNEKQADKKDGASPSADSHRLR